MGNRSLDSIRHIYKPKPHKTESAADSRKRMNITRGSGRLPVSVDSGVYTTEISHYASAASGKAIGHMRRYRLSQQQITLLRVQITGAHRGGPESEVLGLAGLANQSKKL